ncbi:MAG: hypothetical protein J6S23_07560 [Clostridia bacterium]|nr:hypothetical protein [Clostridia bacterium]
MNINLERMYNEVKKHIEGVNFSQLWTNFKPLKFALYTDKECFFDGKYVEKTDEFLGNTSIKYNGEIIAIWNVMENTDSIILSSKIIHEMFHGFQMQNNETRFPNELHALYNYKYDDANLSIKTLENQMIKELADEFSFDTFEKLLRFRRYRYEKFNYEYHYEACIEQIEGTANYVELKALEQLSGDLYLQKLMQLKNRIIEASNLLPVRIISYDIGALLLLIINKNGIEYDDGFNEAPFSEDIIKNIDVSECEFELVMSDKINAYYSNAQKIIEEAKAKNDLVTKDPCELLGVNVYNAVYFNNFIISRYCVMYSDDEGQKVEYGDFLIETHEYMKVSKIYRI